MFFQLQPSTKLLIAVRTDDVAITLYCDDGIYIDGLLVMDSQYKNIKIGEDYYYKTVDYPNGSIRSVYVKKQLYFHPLKFRPDL